MHETLRYVGNDVLRCTCRGTGTLLFLCKTVANVKKDPWAIHRGQSQGRSDWSFSGGRWAAEAIDQRHFPWWECRAWKDWGCCHISTSKSVISNSMQVCPAKPVGCWHAKIGKAHYRYHNLRWNLHFDMSVMARTGRPTTVDFSIEPEPFGTGGFRKAFKATSNDRGFNGSTWVIHEEVSRKGCGRHHCFTSEGTFRQYINNNSVWQTSHINGQRERWCCWIFKSVKVAFLTWGALSARASGSTLYITTYTRSRGTLSSWTCLSFLCNAR